LINDKTEANKKQYDCGMLSTGTFYALPLFNAAGAKKIKGEKP